MQRKLISPAFCRCRSVTDGPLSQLALLPGLAAAHSLGPGLAPRAGAQVSTTNQMAASSRRGLPICLALSRTSSWNLNGVHFFTAQAFLDR